MLDFSYGLEVFSVDLCDGCGKEKIGLCSVFFLDLSEFLPLSMVGIVSFCKEKSWANEREQKTTFEPKH